MAPARCGIVMAVIVTMVCGCAATPDAASNPPSGGDGGDAQPTHVTVKDLSDPSLVQRSAMIDPASASHRFIAQRLILEQDSPRFALATAMLKPVEMDSHAQAVWAANNLRIGKLERSRVALFMANLPKPINTDVVRIFNPTVYSPLTLIDRNQGVQRVRLMAANGRASLVRLIGGQHQLLLKVVPPLDASLGPAKLHVLPHHFGPAPALLPRGQQEKTLDGTSFHEFQVDLPIDDDFVWVIWADLPEPPTTQPPAIGAAPGTRDDSPISLGEAMFSGELRHQPVQAVVMIATEK